MLCFLFLFSNTLILIGKIYILDLYNIIPIFFLICSISPWFIQACTSRLGHFTDLVPFSAFDNTASALKRIHTIFTKQDSEITFFIVTSGRLVFMFFLAAFISAEPYCY
jgi:hypothetical protein